MDNTFLWDFDLLAGGKGQSAQPPAGSALTIGFTVDFARSQTTLNAPCGGVTLNQNPSAAYYKALQPGLYNIEIGIDSCVGDVVTPPIANITSTRCNTVLFYVLDEANFMVRLQNDFLVLYRVRRF